MCDFSPQYKLYLFLKSVTAELPRKMFKGPAERATASLKYLPTMANPRSE